MRDRARTIAQLQQAARHYRKFVALLSEIEARHGLQDVLNDNNWTWSMTFTDGVPFSARDALRLLEQFLEIKARGLHKGAPAAAPRT